jgi:hypothetical protein
LQYQIAIGFERENFPAAKIYERTSFLFGLFSGNDCLQTLSANNVRVTLGIGIGGHIAAEKRLEATGQRMIVPPVRCKSKSGDLAGAIAVQLGAIH